MLNLKQVPVAIRLVAMVAATASIILSALWLFTQSRVKDQQRIYTEKQLSAVLATLEYNNNLGTDQIVLSQASGDMTIYRARLDGTPVAAIYDTVSPHGYSGNIRLLIGIDMSNELTGVRVLEHRETPGLGDGIEVGNSDWILQFDGESISSTTSADWAVKKDNGKFDQFTGATITPRAVVNQVYSILTIHEEIASRIYPLPAGSELTP